MTMPPTSAENGVKFSIVKYLQFKKYPFVNQIDNKPLMLLKIMGVKPR